MLHRSATLACSAALAAVASADITVLDQLPWDGQDGQASSQGGAFPLGARAADDAVFPAGPVSWRVGAVRAHVLANFAVAPGSAFFEFYRDAGAVPAAGPPAGAATVTRVTALGTVGGFTHQELEAAATTGSVFVRPGGRLWFGAHAVTAQANGAAYLGTFNFNGPLNGLIGHQRTFDATGVPRAWQPVDSCCIGISDFALRLVAETPTWFLLQAPSDLGGFVPSEKAPPSRNSRAADDVRFPVGNGRPWRVTGLRAIIATNTAAATGGQFEFYPAAPGGGPLDPGLFQFTQLIGATAMVDYEQSLIVEGRTLRVKELIAEGTDAAPLLTVPAGTTLFVAPTLQHAYALQERAYVASHRFGLPPAGSGAWARGPALGVPGWAAASTIAPGVGDLALAVRAAQERAPGDRDGDGDADVDDLFAFLSSWFRERRNADLDEDGVVDVDDIFAYLRLFFS